MAGASPETLVKLEDGVLHTFPWRAPGPGETAAQDQALEAELLDDDKELAEHDMLVDLGRNDLGKVSRFGTVAVEQFHTIQRFSHVMHIGSTVRGVLREDRDALDAVAAVLPAGTLSGAPRSGPASGLASWRGTSGGAMAGPSGTWTSPATWIPASPSALPTRRMGGSLSAAGRASWPIPSPKPSMRSA